MRRSLDARVFEHSIYDLELGARFIIRTTLLRAVTHVCVGVGEPPSSVTAHYHRATPPAGPPTTDRMLNNPARLHPPSSVGRALSSRASEWLRRFYGYGCLQCDCESSCFRHQHSPDLASASHNLNTGRFPAILTNYRRYSLNLGCCLLLLVQVKWSMDGLTKNR